MIQTSELELLTNSKYWRADSDSSIAAQHTFHFSFTNIAGVHSGSTTVAKQQMHARNYNSISGFLMACLADIVSSLVI